MAQTAQGPQDAPDTSAAQNSVKLAKVVVDLPAGTPWLSLKVGSLFCLTNPITQTWLGGRVAQSLPPYFPSFNAELERAGYKVITPGEDNLFDPESDSADYEVAAVITDEHVDGCVASGVYFSDRGAVRGESAMKIDWQVYSPIKKQVVAHVTTTGSARLDNGEQGGVTKLVMASFTENARELAANVDFRAALSAPKAFTAGFQMPGQQIKIALSGSLKAGPRKIADAAGSVVTILTGTGSGSGVPCPRMAMS
jgi:hypothetical protein